MLIVSAVHRAYGVWSTAHSHLRWHSYPQVTLAEGGCFGKDRCVKICFGKSYSETKVAAWAGGAFMWKVCRQQGRSASAALTCDTSKEMISGIHGHLYTDMDDARFQM
eukprot:4381975-Pleurochrysis_carterae.AAC.1